MFMKSFGEGTKTLVLPAMLIGLGSIGLIFGCGNSSPAEEQRGYFGAASDEVAFVQWTETDGHLTGQFQEMSLKRGDPLDWETSNSGFTGVRDGTSISISFSALGSSITLTGTLNGDTLTLVRAGDSKTGLLSTMVLRPGTAEDYNKAATEFRNRIRVAQATATAEAAAAEAQALATAAAAAAAVARAEGITLPVGGTACPPNSTLYTVDDYGYQGMEVCVLLGNGPSYYPAPNQSAAYGGSAGCRGLQGGESWQAIADGPAAGPRLCILAAALRFLEPQAEAAKEAAFRQACSAHGGQVEPQPAGPNCVVSYSEWLSGSVIQSPFSVALKPDGSWDQARADEERRSCESLATLDRAYPTGYHAHYYEETGVCVPQAPEPQ